MERKTPCSLTNALLEVTGQWVCSALPLSSHALFFVIITSFSTITSPSLLAPRFCLLLLYGKISPINIFIFYLLILFLFFSGSSVWLPFLILVLSLKRHNPHLRHVRHRSTMRALLLSLVPQQTDFVNQTLSLILPKLPRKRIHLKVIASTLPTAQPPPLRRVSFHV